MYSEKRFKRFNILSYFFFEHSNHYSKFLLMTTGKLKGLHKFCSYRTKVFSANKIVELYVYITTSTLTFPGTFSRVSC